MNRKDNTHRKTPKKPTETESTWSNSNFSSQNPKAGTTKKTIIPAKIP